ncbi:aldo/keto reductase [Gordoniibacillus kamchatkensis]|uniref:aldo/keto reductase n=1 Tax=Gordoniibacillus kamchatkensis TaxID=1590651 RepID=UPI000697C4D5|nr:aldo/keto reductase [Paenibacillus sp. VKM B-2647]
MRIIEKNGLRLSQLTLGTVQLGMPYGIANNSGMPSEEQSFAILDEAWNGGVVSYDTAAAYGRSEEILGRYFAGKKPTLITKLHIRIASGAGAAEVKKLMYGMVETSLSRLNIPSIPLLMLHNTDVLGSCGDAVADGFRSLKRDA